MKFRHRYFLARKAGFTLVELMVIVSIIGILASIAIPKFADMLRKAKEGTLKGNLGTIRSALNIYYADMEGYYPIYGFNPPQDSCTMLMCLVYNNKYLTVLPTPAVPDYHVALPSAEEPSGNVCQSAWNSSTYWSIHASACAELGLTPLAYWVYFTGSASTPPPTNWGEVDIGCTHTDTRGTVWSSY